MKVAEQMAKHIAVQGRSGLTVKQYCRQASIKEQTFFYWRRKMKTLTAFSPSTGFTEIKPAAVDRKDSLCMVFPSGVQVSFAQLPSIAFLKKLLA